MAVHGHCNCENPCGADRPRKSTYRSGSYPKYAYGRPRFRVGGKVWIFKLPAAPQIIGVGEVGVGGGGAAFGAMAIGR
jgi:hypothetical protein